MPAPPMPYEMMMLTEAATAAALLVKGQKILPKDVLFSILVFRENDGCPITMGLAGTAPMELFEHALVHALASFASGRVRAIPENDDEEGTSHDSATGD